MIYLILFLLGCRGNEPTQTGSDQQFENLDMGQQHPPIPANNPAWEWNADGFVPDFGWYGEHSWADVYMRVAGHISAIGRDSARLHAEKGQLEKAAQIYTDLAQQLRRMQEKSKTSSHATAILSILTKGAERDAKWLSALAKNKAPEGKTGEISQLRAEYYRLALRNDQGENVQESLKALQQKLDKNIKKRPELKIDEFKDFTDRHALRGRLFEAYIDSLDPLGISERWGYWKSAEINRQLHALGWAAGQLGGVNWGEKLQNAYGKIPPATPQKAIFLPSHALETIHDQDQSLSSKADEFGRLPTGDSLIDVGGTPGPMAIGSLMKWGLEDKTHRKWLEKTASEIVSKLDSAKSTTEKAIQKLKKGTHGSKYYNIKQFRNAVVRQLARSGRHRIAHEIWMSQLPFKYQDWACPNREGIVLGIAGRLLAEAKDPDASTTLEKAMTASLDFYQKSLDAEAGKINGPRPPAFGAGQGSHKGTNPHKNHRPSPSSAGAQPAPPPPRR